MHKFSHIKSLKTLEEEILKSQLKKKIIKEEMNNKARAARNILKPFSFGIQLLRMFGSADASKKPSSMLLRGVTEIISTVEASKYGIELIKKIFR